MGVLSLYSETFALDYFQQGEKINNISYELNHAPVPLTLNYIDEIKKGERVIWQWLLGVDLFLDHAKFEGDNIYETYGVCGGIRQSIELFSNAFFLAWGINGGAGWLLNRVDVDSSFFIDNQCFYLQLEPEVAIDFPLGGDSHFRIGYQSRFLLRSDGNSVWPYIYNNEDEKTYLPFSHLFVEFVFPIK